MPDWTYQTVFKPVLFRLGPRTGRRLALGGMGLLSRLPMGRQVIQLMGHMRPDPRLAIVRHGLTFASQVGLGCALDPQMRATRALAEFGLGFIEIGPIVAHAETTNGSQHLDPLHETLQFDAPRETLSMDAARQQLHQQGPLRLPVFARIEPSSRAEARDIVDELQPFVAAFIVPLDSLELIRNSQAGAAGDVPRLFVAIDADAWQDSAGRGRCEQAVRDGWIQGVVVDAPLVDGARQLGKAGYARCLETVERVRSDLGTDPIVIGAAGAHAPIDAFDYLEAGADLVQVDSGLVFAGPGLPKRINEALLYRRLMAEPAPPPARLGGASWFWAWLMGLAMLLGGVLAMAVATTRVVLPYDESMSGLSREDLLQINDRLLAFMTHDRVTLAGTMIAVGILYTTLAWWGIRRGVHWAGVTVIASGFLGFFTFFSFLGFGYFDPFHAFVTAILFQFLLLTMHADIPLPRRPLAAPGLWNDGRWRANQWGQLLFVVHGAVLIVAGAIISSIGMTSVFVPEDLEFLCTTADDLYGTHPQLVPLVAHDRATFGGMLIACGVATLLPALWGFQRGQAWLWWGLMLSGSIAYGATILVHWSVGYDSLKHLLPAYGGLTWLALGGLASYWFLAAPDPRLAAEWQRRLTLN